MIGTGHVMRCIALAQAWQDAGGRAAFAMAESTEAVRARLARESCDALPVAFAPGKSDDARQTIALAEAQNCKWVVVDGYQFDADYVRALREAGLKVLFVDDYGHLQQYAADVVLNQNVSATPALYPNREPGTRLFLGPRYVLLRREFGVWRGWKRSIPPVCRAVLVLMGGSDEANVTATVIDALHLAGVDNLQTTVLVGGSNRHFTQLCDRAAHSGPAIELLRDVSDVGELIARADIAIAAAGSTVWELCLLGLPALLIDVADNQTAAAKELHKRGCAIHIGDRAVTAETVAERLKSLIGAQGLRQSLSQCSGELVDGNGATRVVSILRGQERLRLRPVQEDDRHMLWEWANDPGVRAASFSPDPIPWETHVAWFDEKLRSSRESGSKAFIFIAEDEEGSMVGQIRFDRRPDGDWEVSLSLDKSMRGRGLANALIANGVRELLKETGRTRIHAYVKPANVASAKLFERVAFRTVGMDQVRGNAAIHLIYE
jgi:UDP-2,4-diacetamido-2,4,6-trideoxy-beta-L-altropyranose hydrolase